LDRATIGNLDSSFLSDSSERVTASRHRGEPTRLELPVKYTHARSKVFFTFGVYLWFWHYSLMCNLRDDFNVDIDPGREMSLLLVPFYGAYRWWLVLKHIQGLQQHSGLGVVMSPARAFWISSAWFGSAVYVNKQINALYFFRQGHRLGEQAAAAASVTPMPIAPQIFPVADPGALPRAV
jgi:hypothetical protein